MLIKNFVWAYDDEYGLYGWILKDSPSNYNVGSGMMVAHDCLEHVPNPDSSWEDELRALGAAMFIRGMTGFLGNKHNTKEETLSSDFANCFRFFVCGDREIKQPPKVRIGDAVSIALKKSVELAIKEYEDNWGEYDDEDDTISESLIESVTAWAVHGARRAKKRFSGCYDPVYLFNKIQKEVNELKHVEEGSTLKILISLAKESVEIRYSDPVYE